MRHWLPLALMASYITPAHADQPAGRLVRDSRPYDGVRIQRWRRDTPPADWLLVSIDLRTPGLGVCVSPVRDATGPAGEPVQAATAQTTLDFLRTTPAVDLAVNTVAYWPFPAANGSPVFLSEPVWQGDRTARDPAAGSLMLGVSPGGAVLDTAEVVRAARPHVAVGSFFGDDPPEASVLVRRGEVVRHGGDAHGRTAAGVSGDGRVLFLLVADGYNACVSDGLSPGDASHLLHAAGAHDGVLLDGGGSSTLVGRGSNGEPVVVNRPAGLQKRPGTLRYVGANLGFTGLRHGDDPLPALADWQAAWPVAAWEEVRVWGRVYPGRAAVVGVLAVAIVVAVARRYRRSRKSRLRNLGGIVLQCGSHGLTMPKQLHAHARRLRHDALATRSPLPVRRHPPGGGVRALGGYELPGVPKRPRHRRPDAVGRRVRVGVGYGRAAERPPVADRDGPRRSAVRGRGGRAGRAGGGAAGDAGGRHHRVHAARHLRIERRRVDVHGADAHRPADAAARPHHDAASPTMPAVSPLPAPVGSVATPPDAPAAVRPVAPAVSVATKDAPAATVPAAKGPPVAGPATGPSGPTTASFGGDGAEGDCDCEPTPTVHVRAIDPTAARWQTVITPELKSPGDPGYYTRYVDRGTTTGAFEVWRGGPMDCELTVTYTVGGSAVAGEDYKPLSGTVTIPKGERSAGILVEPLHEESPEGFPYVDVVVELDGSFDYGLAQDPAAGVTIAAQQVWWRENEDGLLPGAFTPFADLAYLDPYAAELQDTTSTGCALVVREGIYGYPRIEEFVVSLTHYPSTATAGQDYAALPTTVTLAKGQFIAPVIVTPVDDQAVEGDEFVRFHLSTATNTTGYEITIGDNEHENHKPEAVDDEYEVSWNSREELPNRLEVAAAGVLANDTDLDTDGLVARMPGAPPEHAAEFEFHCDGSFTYVPELGYTGDDVFHYTVSDGELTSAGATVTIHVVNHPPVGADDAYSTLQDERLEVDADEGVLANDSDPDGD